MDGNGGAAAHPPTADRRRHHTAHDRQISHSFRATHSFNMHIHFIRYQPMSTTRDYENWLKNGERDAPKLRQLQKSSTSRVFWWCPINCRSFWCIVADDMRLTNLYYEGWWLSGNPMVDVCGLWIWLCMLVGRTLNASRKWADFQLHEEIQLHRDKPTKMIRVRRSCHCQHGNANSADLLLATGPYVRYVLLGKVPQPDEGRDRVSR